MTDDVVCDSVKKMKIENAASSTFSGARKFVHKNFWATVIVRKTRKSNFPYNTSSWKVISYSKKVQIEDFIINILDYIRLCFRNM